jgi:small subunit ribosomal protein S15
MALMKQEKEQIVRKFQRAGLDTGSPEVQVALLSERITRLTDHFKTHDKDQLGRRGMFKLVSQRRKLLDYLRRVDSPKYLKLIDDLKLRK